MIFLLNLDYEGSIVIETTIGGSEKDGGKLKKPLDGNNLFIYGESTRSSELDRKAYVAKVDLNFNIVWQKWFDFNINSRETVTNLIEETNGSIFLLANAVYTIINEPTGWFLKIDNEGDNLWS